MHKVHEKLDQDVVDALIKLKKSGDSYSDVIRRLILLDIAGKEKGKRNG